MTPKFLAQQAIARQKNIDLTNQWRVRSFTIHRSPAALQSAIDHAEVAAGAAITESPDDSISDGAIDGTVAENKSVEGWVGLIEAWLSGYGQSRSTTEIMTNCLSIDATDKVGQMAVSNIMKELGYAKKRESRNGQRDYYWSILPNL